MPSHPPPPPSPRHTPVLIVGAGSAGLAAATWLSRYRVPFVLLERRQAEGPLTQSTAAGHADGVQCRTVEVFESFGISEPLLKEAYHVLEVAFWVAPDGESSIVRTRWAPDALPGMSHLPHVILNQARVNGLMLGAVGEAGGGQGVVYGVEVEGVEVVEGEAAAREDPEAYAVRVRAVRGGVREEWRARYVLACDGAHSVVRKSLGIQMVGDSTDTIWGVMDVYPQTNFPDIRKKAIIRSNSGSLIIIPREGGSLVRFYIEIPQGVAAKDVKLADLHDAARRVFKPYSMEFAETSWWSAYAIGQRLADRFSQSGRVFLTGDACHTHSPKAGQGMNVSLQDGYNIGWKLGSALTGQVHHSIIDTYVSERQKVAADLIAFDTSFAKLFKTGDNAPKPEYVSEQFIKAGRYMAGLTARYDDSIIVDSKGSAEHLAKNLGVGMRFPSAQVVRFCDARPMQLARALVADGRWRLVVFPGGTEDKSTVPRLETLADFLGGPHGLVAKLTPESADIDSFIEPIVVLSGARHGVEQDQIPDYFQPITGKWRMRDLHKVFVDDEDYNRTHGHAYENFGIDSAHGALVLVRPDQYVAAILSISDLQAVQAFFTALKSTNGWDSQIAAPARL
ncbi:phenol 2-monooxygenase [Diplodia corticola]|uniref:Phenol 2-monooxygenase n=1 Tax=Diplodia corticola TaxID=236234 RepID=A0A1J9R0Q5_9PEZI|nr:phenol 2-monooxygenase [Diplodia corticola]OJD34958.1 phenol 2-monooxygenase [Diplodia corticola]